MRGKTFKIYKNREIALKKVQKGQHFLFIF